MIRGRGGSIGGILIGYDLENVINIPKNKYKFYKNSNK